MLVFTEETIRKVTTDNFKIMHRHAHEFNSPRNDYSAMASGFSSFERRSPSHPVEGFRSIFGNEPIVPMVIRGNSAWPSQQTATSFVVGPLQPN